MRTDYVEMTRCHCPLCRKKLEALEYHLLACTYCDFEFAWKGKGKLLLRKPNNSNGEDPYIEVSKLSKKDLLNFRKQTHKYLYG